MKHENKFVQDVLMKSLRSLNHGSSAPSSDQQHEQKRKQFEEGFRASNFSYSYLKQNKEAVEQLMQHEPAQEEKEKPAHYIRFGNFKCE